MKELWVELYTPNGEGFLFCEGNKWNVEESGERGGMAGGKSARGWYMPSPQRFKNQRGYGEGITGVKAMKMHPKGCYNDVRVVAP